MRALLLALALQLALAPACAEVESAPGESDLPLATIRVGHREITVEVASEPASRRKGLMFRESMPEDHGMLFIFPSERPLSFWMRNTKLPLSIAYADREGRIVRIADLEPLNERPVPSGAPSLYALEMNRGWFERNGVLEGDRLRELPQVRVR